MQRLHKSPHAGLGLTFFTFLALAIVPFSLRAAGVQVSISPRLSAAIDVWKQIADVLGAGYQSGGESVTEPEATPSEVVCPRHKYARLTDQAEMVQASQAAVESQSQKPRLLRRPHQTTASRSPRIIAADTVKATFELEALSDLKLEKLPREYISWQSFHPSELINRLPVPLSLKVLFRVKSTLPAPTWPLRCKAQVATSGEKPRETTIQYPDNCDL